jgi:hypothetical protein
VSPLNISAAQSSAQDASDSPEHKPAPEGHPSSIASTQFSRFAADSNARVSIVVVDYVVNFVGYSAYVVRGDFSSAEIVAHINFSKGVAGVKPGRTCAAVDEAIGQAIEIGEQLPRLPFAEYVASVAGDQPLAVQFQGVGLFRDGFLEFHAVNQAVIVHPAQGDSDDIWCELGPAEQPGYADAAQQAFELRTVAGPCRLSTAQTNKPALWDIETALGGRCVGLEYMHVVEAKRSMFGQSADRPDMQSVH